MRLYIFIIIYANVWVCPKIGCQDNPIISSHVSSCSLLETLYLEHFEAIPHFGPFSGFSRFSGSSFSPLKIAKLEVVHSIFRPARMCARIHRLTSPLPLVNSPNKMNTHYATVNIPNGWSLTPIFDNFSWLLIVKNSDCWGCSWVFSKTRGKLYVRNTISWDIGPPKNWTPGTMILHPLKSGTAPASIPHIVKSQLLMVRYLLFLKLSHLFLVFKLYIYIYIIPMFDG